jgi:hypothetical protein
MAPSGKDGPNEPDLPQWVMIYSLGLLVLFVCGPLVYLHGYRVWSVLAIYIVVAVISLAGSVAHR